MVRKVTNLQNVEVDLNPENLKEKARDKKVKEKVKETIRAKVKANAVQVKVHRVNVKHAGRPIIRQQIAKTTPLNA